MKRAHVVTLRKNRILMIIGLFLIVAVLVPAIIGLFWTPYDSTAIDGTLKNMKPCLAHPFGTDNFGRDILSRVMEGASTSFIIATAVVAIGCIVGTVVGALTGYYGGIVDAVFMRINDALSAFPSVLLALILVAVIGTGKYHLILAMGVVFIPSFTRVVRSEMLVQKELDYVKNARLMKISNARIIFGHILPNLKTVILSSALIGFQNAVLSEAGLSYLGLGVTPPDPSLGRMLSEAQSYIFNAPWYAIFPGMTILFLTLGLGFVSHARRD